jgi:hypothetical protein
MLDALRLRQHSTKLEMPVRFLLLERRKDDRWWDELMGAGDRQGLAEILVDQTPLELGPLKPDGIWAMVAAIGGHAAETLGRDSVPKRLTAIDPAMRPLFAALAGEALAAGADLRQWTRTDLLDDWLKRERERHWQPAGVDGPHANLAALATMVGGIAEDILATPPDGIELPRPEAISLTAYAAITGRHPVTDDKDTTWFAALEPDLLGSFFVLRHLQAPKGESGVMPSVVKSRADTYRRTAWNQDDLNARAFALFLDRSKDHFLSHPVFAALLGSPVGGRWSRTLWAVLVVKLITPMGSAGQIDAAAALLAQIRTLADDHPDEPELRLRFADGSFSLISAMRSSGTIDEAEALLAQIRTLAEGHPDEPELWLNVARGSFNLINAMGSAGQVDEAKALLAQLRTFAEGYSNEPELRLRFAKGSVNLIYPMGSAGQIDEAEALLAQLRTLADDHPDEPELRLRFADGSFSLISAMRSSGTIDEAEALLAQIRTLAEGHPDELPVVVVAGLAAVLLLVAHLQRKDAQRAKATARSAEGLLRHPAVVAEMRQRFGGDVADELKGLIEALLSDG